MILPPPAASKSSQDGLKFGQDGPRSFQDGSKTSPRPPQDDFEALLFASSFPSSIWVRSGSNLGSISHPLGRPKRPPNRTKKRPKIMLPQDGLQDRSKTAPDPTTGRPKSSPDLPRTPSLGLPRTAPGPPQSGFQDRLISSLCFSQLFEQCFFGGGKYTLSRHLGAQFGPS